MSSDTAPSLKIARRRAVGGSQTELVKVGYLAPGQSLPLLIEPAVDGLDLKAWAASNREFLDAQLLKHGGILFRGFDIASHDAFQQVITAVSENPLEYKERSSPRTEVGGNIYTSTDYPPDQIIFLHNEHSYNNTFPLKIFFYCHIPASQGGETPIADTRRIYERIDPEIRERFERLGYMYVRNFGDGFGLTWQTVFQTDDKAKVEEYCRNANIQFEWKEGDRLRTRQVRRAVATHPRTGEKSWFNHATFFHVSTLPPTLRDALLAGFQEEDLPNNTYYGDGTTIPPEVLDHLREAYLSEQIMFPWQKGDVLMLDNMFVAHARSSFSGPRKVLVGMSEPYKWENIA